LEEQQHDAAAGQGAVVGGGQGLPAEQVGQGQAAESERPNAEEIAAGVALAAVGGVCVAEGEHAPDSLQLASTAGGSMRDELAS
jgi:hypothetical protein